MRDFFNIFRRSLVLRIAPFVVLAVAGTMFLLRADGEKQSRPAPPTDHMTTELVRAAERADICTAANAAGVGLQGAYFAEALMRGPTLLTRVDDVVDFDSALLWPTGIEKKPSSVRWSGWIKPPLSGGYRFHADAPNMQVSVARNLVAGVGANPDSIVQLAAGRYYPIEVSVSQITGQDTRIRLEWTAPHGARYVIPKALLHLPTEVVATPRV